MSQPQIRSAGTLADGRGVQEITLTGGGLTARVLTLGATLRDLRLDGVAHSLTIGSESLGPYFGSMRYAGAVVGPVANRISGAEITVAGRRHPLPANNGPNSLHGGAEGMGLRLWQLAAVAADALDLTLEIGDGVDGFPGNRRFAARYRLTGNGTLALELTGQSDAPTQIALAQHSYWRLGPGPDLTGHRLKVAAGHYLPVDAALIPTGEVTAVEGTAFDYRALRPVGDGADTVLDHNFCLAPHRGPLRPVAWLEGPSARLEISTTEPGLQVYDGVHFGASADPGLDGQPLPRHAALALEPQLWPDAGKHPDWAQPALAPGETYRQETRWRFEKA